MKIKKDTKKNGSFLELDGSVYLIDKKNGRVTRREKIDGEIVLQAFLSVLTQALDRMESDEDFAKAVKNKVKQLPW